MEVEAWSTAHLRLFYQKLDYLDVASWGNLQNDEEVMQRPLH